MSEPKECFHGIEWAHKCSYCEESHPGAREVPYGWFGPNGGAREQEVQMSDNETRASEVVNAWDNHNWDTEGGEFLIAQITEALDAAEKRGEERIIEGPDGLNSHRHRVTMYLANIRDLERRLEKAEAEVERLNIEINTDVNLCRMAEELRASEAANFGLREAARRLGLQCVNSGCYGIMGISPGECKCSTCAMRDLLSANPAPGEKLLTELKEETARRHILGERMARIMGAVEMFFQTNNSAALEELRRAMKDCQAPFAEALARRMAGKEGEK